MLLLEFSPTLYIFAEIPFKYACRVNEITLASEGVLSKAPCTGVFQFCECSFTVHMDISFEFNAVGIIDCEV